MRCLENASNVLFLDYGCWLNESVDFVKIR